MFDNILICDDPQYAKQVVEEIWAHREVSLCWISFFLDAPLMVRTWFMLLLNGGIPGWKGGIWRGRESEKSSGRGGCQLSRAIWIALCSFLSVVWTTIFLSSIYERCNLQEARRAREEGEKRRKDRDHRYRRRRRVSFLLSYVFESFRLITVDNILLPNKTAVISFKNSLFCSSLSRETLLPIFSLLIRVNWFSRMVVKHW